MIIIFEKTEKMNIVITGASKGIGFQTAKLFANNDTNTVIAIARSKDLLDDLEKERLTQNNRANIKGIVLDIEDLNELKTKLTHEISKYINSVDILINNAGYLQSKAFEEFEIDEIQRIYQVNTVSHAIIIQSLLSLIRKSKVKHIINISSMGGFQGSSKFPGLSFYSSSKAALANLTECLAEEYKDEHIKFNCLALGAVNTEMLRTAFPGYNAPLEAKEMAVFIHDFAINGHQYFNGKILPVSISTP